MKHDAPPLFIGTHMTTSYAEELVTNTHGRQYWIYSGDSFYHQRIAGAGPYQKRNMIALRRLFPHARTVLDVGMNIGMNTIEYATFADRVHGFEPTAQTFSMADRNVAMNMGKLPTKNWFADYETDANMMPRAQVQLHNVGIGDVAGEFEILIKENNAGQNHLENIHVPTKSGRPRTRRVEPIKETITVNTLDSYGFTDVDFIKVDVEGYEYAVICGAEQTIQRERPVVQLEMIEGQPEKFGHSCQEILDWFTQRQYRVFLHDGTEVGAQWRKIHKMVERFMIPAEMDVSSFAQ